MNNLLYLWLTNKYAVSWQLALALLLNYPITGLFFGETVISSSGVTNHIVDLVTGINCALTIILFSSLRKLSKQISLAFTVWVYLISSVASIYLANTFRNLAGFEPNSIEVLVSGVAQMFAIHFLFAIAISSLMDSRRERKNLEVQRAKLENLKLGFETQINEINERLRLGVNEKLSQLLAALKNKFEASDDIHPSELARHISEALNEGVRPLSWEIEKHNFTPRSFVDAKKKRISLIERFKFQIELRRVISVRVLALLFLFFDLPVMYFYFDEFGALQTLATIVFTSLVLMALKLLLGKKMFPSWFAVSIYGVTVSLGSSVFIWYRSFTGELTPEVSELALVLSMLQITVIAAIFQSALFRRYAYIDGQRLVNLELEGLVSQLRQRTWVAKKKLARLVHGRVQSELFAAYLQLSQAKSSDPALYAEVSQRIEKALGEISDESSQDSSFEENLQKIVATWGSSFNVATKTSSTALEALETDPIARACAIEVIQEAVNNAAKYGNSNFAAVSIDLTGKSNIFIEVRNPTIASESATSGYGSAIFDEITHEWNLVIADGQAQFTATVILSHN